MNRKDPVNILKNLITDHIEANYYYGNLFGLKLVIDGRTGYFNATKLCNSAGKKFITWKELHTSKTLLSFVFDKLPNGFVTMYNYNLHQQTATSGTYLCNELLLNIASWAYPEKYVEFNNLVINEADREKDNGITDDKINRILFQFGMKPTNEPINDKLDKILHQLERRQKPTV